MSVTAKDIKNAGDGSTAAAQRVADAINAGSNPSYAAVGDITNMAAGDTKAAGTSATAARGDHKHGAPANATGSVAGMMSAADKTKLDAIEAAADVTDLANVSSALGTTAATAVTDTGAGAGNDGKLIKLDASGKLNGRDVGADGTRLDNTVLPVIKEIPSVTQTAGSTQSGVIPWRAPCAGTVVGAYITPTAPPTVAPAANPDDLVVAVYKSGGGTVATKTYNDVTTLPAAGVFDSLGALDATHKVLAAGDTLGYSCAAANLCDLAGFAFHIDFQPASA